MSSWIWFDFFTRCALDLNIFIYFSSASDKHVFDWNLNGYDVYDLRLSPDPNSDAQ